MNLKMVLQKFDYPSGGGKSKAGLINNKGEWVFKPIPNQEGGGIDFRDGLARICTYNEAGEPEKSGYINNKGEWVIEPNFEYSDHFSEGLAAVKLKGKYGFINTKGEMVIEPKFIFDIDAEFKNGIAIVYLPAPFPYIMGKCGIINTKGEWIFKPISEKGTFFEDGIAPIEIGGKTGYINTKGEWVIEPYTKKKGKKKTASVKAPKETKLLEEKTQKKTSSVEVPEEYKGLPIIEIKTKKVNVNGKSSKGFTEYPIVGGVFVGGEDDDVEAQAIVANSLKEFREDANYIIGKFKSDFCDDEDVPVRVEASTKITGYGAAEDVEEMGDVIGCALNAYYGNSSALGAYIWPDWFAKKAIFVVNKDMFTVDENDCLEKISLSAKQLKALKEAL